MNDDNWTTLQSAGKVPPPSPEVLANATRRAEQAAATTRRHSIRRRVLAPVLAAGATAAVIAVVALHPPGTPTADPAAPGATPLPSTSGRSTAHPKPSGGVTSQIHVDCVHQFSVEQLGKAELGFDGTVVAATRFPLTGNHDLDTVQRWKVTFEVHEWFRLDGGKRFSVQMLAGPGVQISPGELGSYQVGDRLLLSGGRLFKGDDPLNNPSVSICAGFIRKYDRKSAATWRQAFSK